MARREKRRAGQTGAPVVSGYTPVFASIYTGTLCGRWPAAAVWASILPLMNRRGELDASIPYIAAMTGWPRELLELGLQQLMEPDPQSRTPDQGGARLVPLVEGRSWGWRAVNFEAYRERARLMSKAAAEVASGENRKRIARRRSPPLTAADRRSPPATAADRLSDSDRDLDLNRSHSEMPTPASATAGYTAYRPEHRKEALEIAQEARPQCDQVEIVGKFEQWLLEHPSRNWRKALQTFASKEHFSERQHDAVKARERAAGPAHVLETLQRGRR